MEVNKIIKKHQKKHQRTRCRHMSLIARLDLFINFVVVFVEQRFAMYLPEVLLDLQLMKTKQKNSIKVRR